MSDDPNTFDLDTISIIFDSPQEIEGGQGIEVGDELVVSRVSERQEGGEEENPPATDRPLWKVNKDDEVRDVFDASTFHSLLELDAYLSLFTDEGGPDHEFDGRGYA